MDEFDDTSAPPGPQWETVTKAKKSGTEHTERLRVEGGWLYRTSMILLGVSMVFVPDPAETIFDGLGLGSTAEHKPVTAQ